MSIGVAQETTRVQREWPGGRTTVCGKTSQR
jgi:hypothetical protein